MREIIQVALNVQKKKIKYFTINENIKNSRILSLLLTIICIVTIF